MFSNIQQSSFQLHFIERGDPDRSDIEEHIHATYARAYKADIKNFMPLLIALKSNDSQLCGAMGLRSAQQEPLLLEHYLDQPIEQTIASQAKRVVSRARVVELGNLAAGSPGTARMLVMALNAYLQGANFEWVTFTAIPTLKNVFQRLDLRLIELGPADANRLGKENAEWGTYYQHKPSVMAGDIRYGFERLNRMMQQERIQQLLGGLWQQALQQGHMVARHSK